MIDSRKFDAEFASVLAVVVESVGLDVLAAALVVFVDWFIGLLFRVEADTGAVTALLTGSVLLAVFRTIDPQLFPPLFCSDFCEVRGVG